VVARPLASRPEIIFADEPTGNLDSRAGTEILTFMRRVVDKMGQTIVMVTHDPMAGACADRIVFLADGPGRRRDARAHRRAAAGAHETLRGDRRNLTGPTVCRRNAFRISVTAMIDSATAVQRSH